jgi:GGDEF domain-containing protein
VVRVTELLHHAPGPPVPFAADTRDAHFYERLEQEIARARRYGTPVSLLMIDLDGFKAFNDPRGHPAGDAVLRAVADVLRTQLRQHLDIAARHCGEEFAVILPNTPMQPIGDCQMEMDLSGRCQRDVEPPAPGHRDGAGAPDRRRTWWPTPTRRSTRPTVPARTESKATGEAA